MKKFKSLTATLLGYGYVEFSKRFGRSLNVCKKEFENGYCSLKIRGIKKHPLKATHSLMIQRCYNPKATSYGEYGGRGIKVCHEWFYSFYKFVEDMGEKPPNTTLDRINNNLGYFKENCRWATASEQGINRNIPKKQRGERNIFWNKKYKKWTVSMFRNNKQIYLGSFFFIEDARAARDNFLVKELLEKKK